MTQAGNRKNSFASGWILVTGLLLFCLTGTGLTWWNYSRQVFSSAQGLVVNEGAEQHVVVMLPESEARVIKVGHGATVTVGNDKNPLKGRVISVNPTPNPDRNVVIVRLTNVRSPLPTGAACEVTIDTTVPPMEGNY
jgi:multidrug resistance efflux pump